MRRFILLAGVLAGCAHTPVTHVGDAAFPDFTTRKEIRAGVEPVAPATGGQVVIPKVERNVITVEPRPPIFGRPVEVATRERREAPRPRPTTKPKRDAEPWKAVWKKLCAGKALSEKERDILEDHPLPQSWDGKRCHPVWNGEK